MQKFQSLTKYISLISQDDIGTWITDKVTTDGIRHVPFPIYSRMVDSFEKDFFAFIEEHAEFDFCKTQYYGDILKKNGLYWNGSAMRNADVSDKDALCILALIYGLFRLERFGDGWVYEFFKDGVIEKWLKRLLEIDEEIVENT